MATAPTTAKARAVQMPGEPVQTNPESDAPADAGQTQVDAASDEPEHPAVIALRELEAKLAAAEAKIESLSTDNIGNTAPVFDMTKPHQTGKGWFVPETHGTPVKKG